jgi:ribulose kinase
MVLPDFNGNAPHWEPRARGVIYGPALDHSFDSRERLDYVTAIGIGLSIRRIVDAFSRHGYGINALYLTGRHGGSPLLVRLYADATNRHVLLPEEDDSALLGTAISASLAAGPHGSMSDAAQAMRRSRTNLEPNAATRSLFADHYPRFLRMQDHGLERRQVEGCGKPRNRPTLPQGIAGKAYRRSDRCFRNCTTSPIAAATRRRRSISTPRCLG